MGFLNEFILHRHEANPIIRPKDCPFPADAIMNCGQVMHEGKTLLLCSVPYRGFPFGERNAAGMHIATSEDGIHFEIAPEPFITGRTEAPYNTIDWWCIDPRVTKIDNMYYIVRPGQGPTGPAALLERTKDWKTREFLSCIALPPNRVPCLFPEKIGGRYYRLDRPYLATAEEERGSIWLSASPDLLYWGDHRPLVEPYGPFPGSYKIGPTTPVKTDEGWLVIIHGVLRSCADSRYSLSAILLDLEDPSRVIGKMRSWILTPDAPYELSGHVSNVVFACGAIPDYEIDRIRVYYGAADTTICLASGSLSELVEACRKQL
ncbi:MAG: hypothetical protein GXY38_09720 [Planctomycetes bacterium]|jgi:predicted GH43/DUF377 family glycosyl hydrolase|nr:hypothetical protein [Planctomycetota bacterium]